VIRVGKAEALARVAAAAGPGCRMCAVVDEAAPIATSDEAIAVLDAFACRPGHVLVVLRRHEERIAALAWPEWQAVQHLVWRVSRAIEVALAPTRIYVAALGAAQALPNSFPHLHVHVVPLYDGGEDDRPASVFTWTHGMYVFESPDEEAALRARLVAAL
jgi:diadenosine tetraphosphate (Ap4A) HIT family hydrolase